MSASVRRTAELHVYSTAERRWIPWPGTNLVAAAQYCAQKGWETRLVPVDVIDVDPRETWIAECDDLLEQVRRSRALTGEQRTRLQRQIEARRARLVAEVTT